MNVLVTGAQGFIGSWIVRALAERGAKVVLMDRESHNLRLRDVVDADKLAEMTKISGNIDDVSLLSRAIGDHGITHVIHLAGLQVPQCKADPMLGARVNVLGTLAVFEAVKQHADQVGRVVYASSVAVIGPESDYPPGMVPNEGPLLPRTHYGVYKMANEATARIYANDFGIDSVGLRPWTVYGPGRDQGMTSDPTRAMKAAVVGKPFTIGFTGRTDMQYAEDIAGTFVRCCEAPYAGAGAYNIRGAVVDVDEIIALIRENAPGATIDSTGSHLPIHPDLDDSALLADIGEIPKTPLAEGIRRTMDHFRRLNDAGTLSLHDLD